MGTSLFVRLYKERVHITMSAVQHCKWTFLLGFLNFCTFFLIGCNPLFIKHTCKRAYFRSIEVFLGCICTRDQILGMQLFSLPSLLLFIHFLCSIYSSQLVNYNSCSQKIVLFVGFFICFLLTSNYYFNDEQQRHHAILKKGYYKAICFNFYKLTT